MIAIAGQCSGSPFRARSHRRWTLLWREWRCDVIWSRDSLKKSSCIHTRPQRSACKATKPGEAFLLRGLLLWSVAFEDHENKFPCSVTSLVDTRKQMAYPPHKLKRVDKLLTVLRTWVRRPKATADQGQCSFSVAAPLPSTSQSWSSRTQRLPRLSL